jgi:hypothetical protein
MRDTAVITGTIAPVGVSVETVLLGVADTHLTYRIAAGPLGDHHPDAVARTLAGLDHSRIGALLHSTSWRYGSHGVILTYAALPDPDPAGAIALDDPIEPPVSHDPLAPSPTHVHAAQVAAHACRHLAYLRHTDPVVAAVARESPRMWSLLARYRPAVAGLLVQPAVALR